MAGKGVGKKESGGERDTAALPLEEAKREKY